MGGGTAMRWAVGKVKDKASIGLAKVVAATFFSDLDVAVVKATLHDPYPPDEKHVRRILTISSRSRAHVSAAVSVVARRLRRTKHWAVALKSLHLLHRFVSDGTPAFHREIFLSSRRGRRLLDLSQFRDSAARQYSEFVRAFAVYLNHSLDLRLHAIAGVGRRKHEDEAFSRLRDMQSLLDRFLSCRPAGEVKNDQVVVFALHPLIKESFKIYHDITDLMSELFDRFTEMEVHDCVKVHEIFTRVATQLDRLYVFYRWCDSVGIGRSSEYPVVEKISLKQLHIMDEFIRNKTSRQSSAESFWPVKEVIKRELPAPPSVAAAVDEKSGNNTLAVEKQIEKKNENLLINLMDDDVNNNPDGNSEQAGENLALVLFEGEPPPKWETFSPDWETELMASASAMSSQNNTYQLQQAAMYPAFAGGGAFPTPGMLALPAPPGLGMVQGGTVTSVTVPATAGMTELETTWGQPHEYVGQGVHSGHCFVHAGYSQPGSWF